MNVQVIEREGKPEWAILPYEDFLQLMEQAESGEEETVPSELAYTLIEGKNPIKAWREYRHLSQKQLADSAGISIPFLSQIESGKRKASISIMVRLAKALQVRVDDLVTEIEDKNK